MKKTHIIAIIIIAISIGAIMANVMNESTYAHFTEAFENQGSKYTVKGTLNKEKPIIYDPGKNANVLEFWMLDDDGVEKKVILNKEKPTDFERAEGIVLKGRAEGDIFYATSILMKCPSKYNEQQEFK